MAHATEDDGQLSSTFPATVDELTPSWLTEVLNRSPITGRGCPRARVVEFRTEPIGVGVGLLGTLHRVALTWSDGTGPASVVVKGPASGERSQAVAALFDMYDTEVGFYRDLAAATGVAVPCHHVEDDPRSQGFVLVLADLSDDATLDQITGCPPDRAHSVVTALADLHARHWDGNGLGTASWLRPIDHRDLVDAFRAALRATWPEVRARLADDVAPILAFGDRLEAVMPAVSTALARTPVTMVHGDARLDNMFFAGDGGVTLCDWQLTGASRGVRDLAYFITQSLTPEDRAACERPLVDAYLARLAANGVTGYGAEEAWHDYRAATVLGLVYAIVAGGGLDQATPYSVALTRAMLQRAAAAVADHDGASLG